MKKEIGYCNKCGYKFSYELIHNGFNETTYAYCDSCGKVAFLSEHYKNIPKDCLWFFEINPNIVQYFNILWNFCHLPRCCDRKLDCLRLSTYL